MLEAISALYWTIVPEIPRGWYGAFSTPDINSKRRTNLRWRDAIASLGILVSGPVADIAPYGGRQSRWIARGLKHLRSDLPSSDFDKLRKLDTCVVSNAIERLNARLRNEGFVLGSVRCMFPDLAPMLGYAATARIQTSFPPMTGRCYHHRVDWWEYVASIPAPRVMVVEDADHTPGLGALVGEIHAAIGLALNCVGYVSNGAVRDLPTVESMGFHLFAGSVVASHAYAHIAEFGAPVEIGGLRIRPGDLIHGDLHGVHTIPLSIASEIPKVASEILSEERQLVEFCRSAEFSVRGLSERLQQESCGDVVTGQSEKEH